MGTSTIEQAGVAEAEGTGEYRPERLRRTSRINVGRNERMVSTIAGSLLAAWGVRRADLLGTALATVGGIFLYRGITGRCMIMGTLGVSTAGKEWLQLEPKEGIDAELHPLRAVHAEHTITINRPARELFDFWRNFENLPAIMRYVDSVSVAGGRRSHWKAKAPAGTAVEWDAEIVEEAPNELIAWKSLPPAAVPNRGSVRFQEAPGGRGTEMRIELEYEPPAGNVGRVFAKLFGMEPEQQLSEDLRHFKQIMEAGEIPTTEGQPSGRRGRFTLRES